MNFKKLNQINKLSQLPIPRVDQVLDVLGTARVFSLFHLVSSFHQIKRMRIRPPLQRSPHPQVARHAQGQQCFAWMVRQGDQSGD